MILLLLPSAFAAAPSLREHPRVEAAPDVGAAPDEAGPTDAPDPTDAPGPDASDPAGIDGPDAPTPRPDAWPLLLAEQPALATALATRNVDDETLAAAADALLDADPRLVALLLPDASDGPVADGTGEDKRIDLVSADVWLEGTVLHGTVAGRGVALNGAWLDLDLGNGPAPDLRLGFGRGWVRAVALDGSQAPVPDGRTLPVVADDRVTFMFDLGDRAPVSGSAVARVQSLDGRITDTGPAGVLGVPPDEALDVLLALADRPAPMRDPDLAVALAITFGALRPLVADDVVGLVDADAAAWLRYGEGLDTWLAAAGAEWRFTDLDAFGKLTWAWPAAQAVVYGAVPLAGVRGPLDAEHYRFVVPDVTTLERFRDAAPVFPTAAESARAVDVAINARLRYRTHDPLMESLCRRGALTDDVCEGWRLDSRAGADLGLLGDTAVPLWEGVSATRQAEVYARQGVYVGDCSTATALTIVSLQAIGIPAIGLGWSGEDFSDPTHDVPLWYDGAAFRGTQRGPGKAWAQSRAFVYVTLPGVHPVNGFTLGQEPGGWSRGGAVAGGWTSYADVERVLREGLPAAVVGAWIDVEAEGGWPTW